MSSSTGSWRTKKSSRSRTLRMRSRTLRTQKKSSSSSRTDISPFQSLQSNTRPHGLTDIEISNIKRCMIPREICYEFKIDLDDSDDGGESDFMKPDPKTKLPPNLCNICSEVHSPSELCHNRSCIVCYSKCHTSSVCPYFDYIPQGADFDRECYEIRCQCDCPFFDTINWVCAAKYCDDEPASAKLWLIECDICASFDHNTFNCPVDKDRAATLRSEEEDYYQWPGLIPLRSEEEDYYQWPGLIPKRIDE